MDTTTNWARPVPDLSRGQDPSDHPDAAAGQSSAARRWRGTALRLERFLSAAAGAPPSSCWHSTVDDSIAATVTDGLFAHQTKSIDWMVGVESTKRSHHAIHVQPVELGGMRFGEPYTVKLPCGGVIGHPPGAGKTRIAAALMARRRCDTLLACPGHLLSHWADELNDALKVKGEAMHRSVRETSGVKKELIGYGWDRILLIGYHAIGLVDDASADDDDDDGSGEEEDEEQTRATLIVLGRRVRSERLIIDEPQDAEPAVSKRLVELSSKFQTRWIVCGTASAHLRTIGPLLLGQRRWRAATTTDEWRSQPTLSHVFRHRFLRDPPWACLPRPPLAIHEERVTPSQEEAVAALMNNR